MDIPASFFLFILLLRDTAVVKEHIDSFLSKTDPHSTVQVNIVNLENSLIDQVKFEIVRRRI